MNLKLLSRILRITVIALMIMGLALVLSASNVYSAHKFRNDFYHMFTQHLIKVVIASVALIFFTVVPYDVYKTLSKKAVIFIALLLIVTFIMSAIVKGAHRWLSFGFFSFQPSEAAKLFLLMHVAYLIESKGKELQNYKEGFFYPVLWIFFIAGLVIIQPNVSTSIIIILASFAVLFVGGAKLTHVVGTLGGAGLVAGIIAIAREHSRVRIMDFINSIIYGTDINLQVKQAKIALGSGGFFGIGIGQSRQSDLFLPESYGDFIFSVLGEEMGFIGAIVVLLVYLLIFIAGIIIAKNAKDQFGQLLAFGISFTIILNAFINAAVVTGIFPTTGIPLPFISYGGTSIVFMCASAGILANIAISANKTKEVRAAKAKKNN